MVEPSNLPGFYYWGDKYPEFCISLRQDNTCSYYKSPDSDYDLPLTPTGTSYNGQGTYVIEGDKVKYKGKGLSYNFGFLYSTSNDAIKFGPVEYEHEGELSLSDLVSHRKGDDGEKINEYYNNLTVSIV